MAFLGASAWAGDIGQGDRLPRCGKCGLAKGCFSPRMQPAGSGERRVLFLAEAPGEEDDRSGKHLVGEGGEALRDVLSSLKTDLDDCMVSYAVLCRPKETTAAEVASNCFPTVLKTIRELQPRVVVLLGEAAIRGVVERLTGKAAGKIEKWRGWSIPVHEWNCWIVATYSPRWILRADKDPVTRRRWHDHLATALNLEHEPLPSTTAETLLKDVDLIFDPRQARLRLKDLTKRSGTIAFDYETTGIKPDHPDHRIVSCAICYEGEETFAFKLHSKNERALSRVLRSDRLRKIGTNIKYEERWTRAKLGHGVAGWYWDTMLASHVLDNRPGITSVKFEALRRYGIVDYNANVSAHFESDDDGFNSIHRIPDRDLLEYNGLDAVIEFMVAVDQIKEMGYGSA